MTEMPQCRCAAHSGPVLLFQIQNPTTAEDRRQRWLCDEGAADERARGYLTTPVQPQALPRSRTCVECEHWEFDPGTSDWSEDTPGDAWNSRCLRDHLSINRLVMFGDQEYERSRGVARDDFGRLLLTARACSDFELASYARAT